MNGFYHFFRLCFRWAGTRDKLPSPVSPFMFYMPPCILHVYRTLYSRILFTFVTVGAEVILPLLEGRPLSNRESFRYSRLQPIRVSSSLLGRQRRGRSWLEVDVPVGSFVLRLEASLNNILQIYPSFKLGYVLPSYR